MTDVLLEPAALWCLAAMAVGGVVQGACGFGFGMVSVGLMGFVLQDPKVAVILPVFPVTAITIIMLVRYFRHISWRHLHAFVPALLCGVPLGVLFLVRIPASWVYAAIAGLLIFSGGYALLPHHHRRHWHRLWAGAPLGLLSGALGGAFSTGGPPAIAYFSNQGLTRFQFVASIQAAFVTTCLLRIICLNGVNLIDGWTLTVSLSGVVMTVVGMLAGNAILGRMSDRQMRTIVCVLQLVLGVVYTVRVLA